MQRVSKAIVAALVIGSTLISGGACGGSSQAADGSAGDIDSSGTSSSVTQAGPVAATEGDPVRIVFNGELSGELVYDGALVKQGVRTALAMLGYQVAGRAIEYTELDNGSDPVVAVEETRTLVGTDVDGDEESDPVDFICGPLSSSAVAGVTFFLGQREEKREHIPQCSVTGQPSDNIPTAGKLGFIPNGIYSSHGYYLGKFAAEVLQYKTANCIHYADRTAEELQAGFEIGFKEKGGTIASLTYVPADTTDFTEYLALLEPADCTVFWVRGKGAIPFVREYYAAGLTATLLVPMSSNYSESQLKYLNALGLGLGIIGCDCYTPLLDNPVNDEFIAAFQQLYPGEYPTPEAFGGWQAIMLYARGVEAVIAQRAAGDSTVDPSDPADVIAAMANLTMDTPAGPITMSPYGKTYVATRDFYILRSKDVGGGRVAWSPIKTYSQVLLGE
jgi:ABC-type branched-subunit amino acid transport system substrate-binding protein